MDSVRSLRGVTSPVRVQERNAGGNKANAEAFRRALQQETPEAGAQQPEPPVRTRLQPQGVAGRKEAQATACHVDVLA